MQPFVIPASPQFEYFNLRYLQHATPVSNDFTFLYTSAASMMGIIGRCCLDNRLVKHHVFEVAFQGFVHRYQQFMKLQAMYPSRLLIPTMDIELIWITHLLKPIAYMEYCATELKSDILDHIPCTGKAYKFVIEEALKETQELWQKHYNSVYSSLQVQVSPARPVAEYTDSQWIQKFAESIPNDFVFEENTCK